MVEATLSKVGNSMAVLLPKALRAQACFEPEKPLRLESPRKGVVVITSLVDDNEDRLSRLKHAEERIKQRQSSMKPWPKGKTADDLLLEGKGVRANEFSSL